MADDQTFLPTPAERQAGGVAATRRCYLAVIGVGVVLMAESASALARGSVGIERSSGAGIGSIMEFEGMEEDDVDTDFGDDFWMTFDRDGDLGNEMPLEEAKDLDKRAAELAGKDGYDSLPRMVYLLYPNETDSHDEEIASKLEGLRRDSQIKLPDGTIIPYWQTLQYANRHMRLFTTRFREGKIKGKVKNFDQISETERIIYWETNMLLRKLLVTDCVKDSIESNTKFPSTFTGFGETNDHRGRKFSGTIFYRHLEANNRGAAAQTGGVSGASAVATGDGITWNNAKKFHERRTAEFLKLFAHEQTHNMGYPHADYAPQGSGKAVKTCFNKGFRAHEYVTRDLAESELKEFEVQEAKSF